MGGLSIIIAVLGFAFVIFIHELGHFLFAKWAGVKVERFSIGMGPIIWSRQIGETEYALSILPVGGYVKMLGQEDLPGQAAGNDDQRSFTNKHPAWRAAILFAGVLFNIVSSYIILLALAWYGMPMVTPQVGSVAPYFVDSNHVEVVTPAYEHNIHVGDRIIAVNGEKVRSFMDVMMYCMRAGTEELELSIIRDGQVIPPIKLSSKYNPQAGRHNLGIGHPYGLRVATVGRLGAEVQADIQADDRIVGIKGLDENFDTMNLVGQQVYDRLHEFNGEEITLLLNRDGAQHEATIRYCDGSVVATSLGAMVRIKAVLPDKPAAAAGLKNGDYVYAINGKNVLNSAHLQGLVRSAVLKGAPVVVTVYRADEENNYTAQYFTMKSTLDTHTGKGIIGVMMETTVVGPVLFDRSVPGSEQSPLASAGIEIGDVLIDFSAGIKKGDDLKDVHHAHVLSIQGGVLQQLPLNKKVYHGLHKTQKRGFFAKVFRVEVPPTSWSGMMVSRVVQVPQKSDPILMVRHYSNSADDLGESRQIDLNYFDESERESLYALEKGDWIIRSDSYAPGYSDPSLAIIRGSDQEHPHRVKVELGHAGVAIALMVEKRPYELASWTEAFSVANAMCEQIVVGTLLIIPRFFKRPENGGIEASKSLSGPIGIFTGLKQQNEYFGFAGFLQLLAVIGINLFLVNLLPIPIVDGGQLVFLGIEVIIRRPVPEFIVNAAMWVGLIMIVSLMIYVIGIDIDREFLQ